jgi:hypothetical protein
MWLFRYKVNLKKWVLLLSGQTTHFAILGAEFRVAAHNDFLPLSKSQSAQVTGGASFFSKSAVGEKFAQVGTGPARTSVSRASKFGLPDTA